MNDNQMTIDEAIAQMQAEGTTHRHGHDTEIDGAASIAEVSGIIRKRVWNVLADHPGGLTDDEGARLMGDDLYRGEWRSPHRIDRLTFGRRRYELYKAGLVAKTDERRSTPMGRKAIVWKAVTDSVTTEPQ